MKKSQNFSPGHVAMGMNYVAGNDVNIITLIGGAAGH